MCGYFQVHAVSLSLRHVTSRSSQKGELEMVSKADASSQKRIKKLARRAQIRLRKTCLMPQRTLVFREFNTFLMLSENIQPAKIQSLLSLKPRTLKITHSIPRRHTEPTHRYARTDKKEIRAVVNALPIMVRVYKLDRSTFPVNTHDDRCAHKDEHWYGCADDNMHGIYTTRMVRENFWHQRPESWMSSLIGKKKPRMRIRKMRFVRVITLHFSCSRFITSWRMFPRITWLEITLYIQAHDNVR